MQVTTQDPLTLSFPIAIEKALPTSLIHVISFKGKPKNKNRILYLSKLKLLRLTQENMSQIENNFVSRVHK